jgi:hypothetical protein
VNSHQIDTTTCSLPQYNLELLFDGADLQLTSNDLKINRRGGFQVGDKRFDALYHFVESGRMNAPTMEVLLEMVQDFHEQEYELHGDLNQAANELAKAMMRKESFTHIAG